MFSSRSSVDLAPNRLSIALARMRAASRRVLDLTESNPTRAAIPYEVDSLLASAREAVARELSASGPAVDPARVVLTASTSEAYSFVFKLLADPGDEVIVPQPSYPLFEHLARLESVRPVPYRLAYDGAWHVDVASVRAAVSPRTRAIVAVSPNNPTGSYLTHGELDDIASLGVPIVSDEVFARFPLGDGARRFPSALESVGAPLVFSLGGLSKMAGLPQMKLAWIVLGGEDACVAAALARLEVIADAFLSVGTPVQHALSAIFASRRTAQDAIRARTRANLAHARDAVAGSPASLLNVEGGWYATVRLPRTRTEEDWVLAFLEGDGVYVHPGHFFDFSEEAYVVVSLLTPEATLREGMAKIVERVRAE